MIFFSKLFMPAESTYIQGKYLFENFSFKYRNLCFQKGNFILDRLHACHLNFMLPGRLQHLPSPVAFMFHFLHFSRLHGWTRAGIPMLCPCLSCCGDVCFYYYARLKFESTEVPVVPFVVPLLSCDALIFRFETNKSADLKFKCCLFQSSFSGHIFT